MSSTPLNRFAIVAAVGRPGGFFPGKGVVVKKEGAPKTKIKQKKKKIGGRGDNQEKDDKYFCVGRETNFGQQTETFEIPWNYVALCCCPKFVVTLITQRL